MKAKIIIQVPGYEQQTIEVELTPLPLTKKRGPYLSKEAQLVRNARIVEAFNNGRSKAQIAERENISEEYVRKILKKSKPID